MGTEWVYISLFVRLTMQIFCYFSLIKSWVKMDLVFIFDYSQASFWCHSYKRLSRLCVTTLICQLRSRLSQWIPQNIWMVLKLHVLVKTTACKPENLFNRQIHSWIQRRACPSPPFLFFYGLKIEYFPISSLSFTMFCTYRFELCLLIFLKTNCFEFQFVFWTFEYVWIHPLNPFGQIII